MKAGQYLTFKIKQNVYGLEIRSVREIKHMQPVSALPDVPPYMVGVINLRDHIIPIMDLRIRLGVEETQFTKDTCIIVVESDSRRMGLIVDSVNTVTDLTDSQIDSTLHETENGGFVRAIGKLEDALVLLIDIKNCFVSENDVVLVKEAA
ncbi:chemotaxis protein CheW [Peredibacter starrii]|uniref:Chemotaxis protein CheW n=1 Tax=Peredibacter starrii TaxID=28202 RepID=A0AAX4HLJ3_9BACT|nr:chemotaxis protein CheW [Peredibacter starrii]WPU64138.1 chemotaxis protein CheW [Peredibacter starrii]